MSYKKRTIRRYSRIETPTCRHTMIANTVAGVTRVGAETYERVELCATCDIENVDLTPALSQANNIITNILTYALLPAFFRPLLCLEGPPSEPVTLRLPFGVDDFFLLFRGISDTPSGSISDRSLPSSSKVVSTWVTAAGTAIGACACAGTKGGGGCSKDGSLAGVGSCTAVATTSVAGRETPACAGTRGGRGCSEDGSGGGSCTAVTVVVASRSVVAGMAGVGSTIWVACAAACARIRLRNPPDFDFSLGADSSIAMKSPPRPSSFLKKSLVLKWLVQLSYP